MCEKRQIDCVFDLKGDPTMLAEALAALEEREAHIQALEHRVTALEGILRSVPELAHLAKLPTERLSNCSPLSVEAEMAAVSLDDQRDRGGELLPLKLVDIVEEGLAALLEPQEICITNTMRTLLGGTEEVEEMNDCLRPAEWPDHERGELLIHTFISMNPLYQHFWMEDMRKECVKVGWC